MGLLRGELLNIEKFRNPKQCENLLKHAHLMEASGSCGAPRIGQSFYCQRCAHKWSGRLPNEQKCFGKFQNAQKSVEHLNLNP